MPDEVRALTPQNAQHAIDLMNQSSRDTSLRYDLDIFGFRWLARYWNFSYDDSMIYYVDNQPAAVVLNSVDLPTRDAYTFFWGAHPDFRHGRIALTLAEASSRHLYEIGCLRYYAESVPDRPVRRYRFVQFLPVSDLVDMRAESPVLPVPDPTVEVRPIQPSDLPSFTLGPGEFQHWCQRHSFLRTAASFVKLFGVFSEGAIKAYAVLQPLANSTTLSELRSPGESSNASHELLRFLLAENYRPPFTVTHVFPNSFTYRLLAASGFTVHRRYSVLMRDLPNSFAAPVARNA